jgi:hypothetical protein
MNIGAGEYFRIEGDPRIPQTFPRSHTRVASIKNMLELGLIEFCSSPPPILDDQTPNGSSMALVGNAGNSAVDQLPLDRAEAEARVLPAVVPELTYDPLTDLIKADWLEFEGLEPHDIFTIEVTPPLGQAITVRTAHDRVFQYAPPDGYGDYTFVVTLQSIDGRTQTGPPTIYEHEEPKQSGGESTNGTT